MAKKIEIIILFLFLIATFFLGGTIVGPFSIRIYFAVFIFLFLIFRFYKFPYLKELKLYILFIFFYFIALYANGELDRIDFIKYFFGRYFICFIAFYAIYSLIYTAKRLDAIIKFIVIIGLLNAVVSILQFMGNPFAIGLSYIINPVHAAEGSLDKLINFTEEDAIGLGSYGFFSSNVANGYFSVIPAVFSLYLFKLKKSSKLINLLIVLFLFIGLFTTQQRLVIVLTLCFYLYYLYLNTKIFIPIVAALLLGVLYILIEYFNIQGQDLGRLQNLNDDNRFRMYSLSIEYIFKNLFFGGQLKFGNFLYNNGISVFSAHNVFFNAFIYSGLFGGVVIVYLYVKMVFKGIKHIFQTNSPQLFIAAAFVIYMLNSLTHNSSLVTGDENIWVLYSLLLVSLKFNNSN